MSNCQIVPNLPKQVGFEVYLLEKWADRGTSTRVFHLLLMIHVLMGFHAVLGLVLLQAEPADKRPSSWGVLVHVVPLEVAEVLDHFPAEQTLVAIRDFPHRHSTSSKEKFSKDAHRKHVMDDFARGGKKMVSQFINHATRTVQPQKWCPLCSGPCGSLTCASPSLSLSSRSCHRTGSGRQRRWGSGCSQHGSSHPAWWQQSSHRGCSRKALGGADQQTGATGQGQLSHLLQVPTSTFTKQWI